MREWCDKGVNSNNLIPLTNLCSSKACCNLEPGLDRKSVPVGMECQADFVKQKGLGVIHMDVRSLVSKWDYVKVWAQQTNADIFFFTETWLSNIIEDEDIAIDGYNVLRNDREGFTKEDFNFCEKMPFYLLSSLHLGLKVLNI